MYSRPFCHVNRRCQGSARLLTLELVEPPLQLEARMTFARGVGFGALGIGLGALGIGLGALGRCLRVRELLLGRQPALGTAALMRYIEVTPVCDEPGVHHVRCFRVRVSPRH